MKKSSSRSLALLLTLSIATMSVTAKSSTYEPLELGNRLELFVDDYLIDSIENLEIRMHSPRSAGTVIPFDQPWEGNVSWPVSVFQDGDI